MPALAKLITFFGRDAVVTCDGRCDKAWGGARPREQLSDNPDDYALLADDELGTAPMAPRTYEGDVGKPQHPDERLNKWCVRECERSALSTPGFARSLIEAPDFSKRVYNIPRRP